MKIESDLTILDDARTLVHWMAAITGEEERTIAIRLREEHRNVGFNVRQAMDAQRLEYYQWSEKLEEFYNTTDAFLFETIVWNRSPLKQEMRRWISHSIEQRFRSPIRLLSFGDGLGFDSLYFAKRGHQVDFFEVSENSRRFASQLFSNEDCKVRIIEKLTNIAPESYDVVVVLDVLEHIRVPEACAGALAKLLRPGGYVYTHSPFWLLTPSVPTHLIENQKYSGDLRRLFGVHGLRPVNARTMWNPIELQKTQQSQFFRRPLSASLRIWLGGYLLWWGRFWNAPHIAVVNWLFASKQIRWEELEEMVRD
ncbi:MAG: methyltransferase domain-containing protein [Pirellulaceae bacterium]|nr:methyltransferase domain-containing protein [Pirellulaceae bacterium]